MSDLEAMLLGLLQGLTEFLPVSSSGHLVLAGALFGAGKSDLAFAVAVHLGTLAAILLYYRARIVRLLGGALHGEHRALAYLGKLLVATLPAVLVGVALQGTAQQLFQVPEAAALALLVTGCLLLTVRKASSRAEGAVPGLWQALWIGLAQAVAIAPGISRSGATLAVALLLGVRATAATEFSFLLGAIAIFGAACWELPQALGAAPHALRAYLVGAAFAWLGGFVAIFIFVRLLHARRFHYFAIYCFAVSAAFFAWRLLPA